jgi:iron complex outermembrane receptor protein
LTKEGYCQVYFDQPLGEALGAVNAATNTSVQRCVLGNPRIFGASIRYEF